MSEKIELLAPVGSIESLYAAIKNGADAVYLGGKLFNARAYASNFDSEELKEAVFYAHLRGVKVYITVNILVDDSEMEDVVDYIKFLYEIDVDAIIVQDIGLSYIIRNVFPDLDLHGSTQMTINNLPGVEFLEEQGFTRVVLARETPVDEIKHISNNSTVELEGFIHGALCMSYSGQCLMSSMIGGRSGNRGTCAQPCRMAYSIVNRDGNLIKDWDKKYVLSPRDLNSLETVEDIIDAGISSLKIEGRMKRPEYVATVVNAYRRVLDYTSSSLTEKDKKNVEQIFNRGFTKGLGFGDFGKTFITKDRPDNRGLYIGKVVKMDKNFISISLVDDIEKGDGLEFQLTNGEYKGIKSQIDGRKGSTIHLERIGNILANSDVYKTSSERLLKEARISYEMDDTKYPIDIDVRIKIGEKPNIKIKLDGIIIETYCESLVESSQKIALTEDKVFEQLSKLGDTIYYIHDFNLILDENAFLPVSVLNQLRRDAIIELNKKISNFNNREIVDDKTFNDLKSRFFKYKKNNRGSSKKLSVKVESIEQFNQLDLNRLDRIYLGFYEDLDNVLDRIKSKNKEAYIWTNKILYQKELDALEDIIRPVSNIIDGISVSNMGSLKFFRDNFDTDIHCDMGLNLFNSYSIRFLNEIGIKSLTLSPELNLQQIKKITEKVDGNIEGIIYGYLPVMITRNCPMAIVKGCKDDKNCKTCNFSKGYGLKDRKDLIFEMYRKDGFSTIYNTVPLFVLDSIDKVFNSGINMARLDFTKEINDISRIQTYLYDYINNIKEYNDLKEFVDDFKLDNDITNGHYFRGII